ncbi:MAG: penicillin-binding protein 2 [Candidatus Magasanikbacteria bacterium]|nr:penicillin-binding protein 2 [Candidatus Magasanikbacteria bacterium]
MSPTRVWSKKKHTFHKEQSGTGTPRLRIVSLFFVAVGCIITGRLVMLMIVQHDTYKTLAQGSHELFAELFPRRGSIYIQDTRTKEEFPLAINRDVFLLYADTREIDSDTTAADIAAKLAPLFGYDDEKKVALAVALNKRTDPYEPIEKKVDESRKDEIDALKLPGIHFVRTQERFYPEKTVAAPVIGFVGKDAEGVDIGRYGIEGYWQETLAGKTGFFEGIRSAKGYSIPLAGKIFDKAEDGADLLTTLDRTLQYTACERLRKGLIEYGATSASLIILDPKTGAIRAMCSLPDFDPNMYGTVESADVYNNTSIFTPYEPGSVFKPLIMAAALNEGVVTPNSVFFDSGMKEGVCQTPIRNANDKSYGDQSMTGILENSINTGMVYVAEQLGKERVRSYIEQFGFGTKLGVTLDTEITGTIDTLSINKKNTFDCYSATASFGQGITVTPLQMISAFASIANGGVLMQPYIIEEIRFADGRREKTQPKEIRRVMEPRIAALMGGMLVSVIDEGQSKNAAVHGYYVAGKTGTGQIAGRGGYSDDTNHSFVGFAPMDNPKFAMIVKFEKPARAFADSTAAPVFKDIANFALQYYGVPPSR